MTWLHGEPTLDEAIEDPVVIAMMRRDGVSADRLRHLLATMRGRLAERGSWAIPLPACEERVG
jgi:hypothetical protein